MSVKIEVCLPSGMAALSEDFPLSGDFQVLQTQGHPERL